MKGAVLLSWIQDAFCLPVINAASDSLQTCRGGLAGFLWAPEPEKHSSLCKYCVARRGRGQKLWHAEDHFDAVYSSSRELILINTFLMSQTCCARQSLVVWDRLRVSGTTYTWANYLCGSHTNDPIPYLVSFSASAEMAPFLAPVKYVLKDQWSISGQTQARTNIQHRTGTLPKCS